jgi:hypothetical protein
LSVEILSDKGTHYFVKTAPILRGGPPRRHRVQRYLCIGGPCAGVWRSSEELSLEAPGQYYPFNNAGSSTHSMVYIHKDLLA